MFGEVVFTDKAEEFLPMNVVMGDRLDGKSICKEIKIFAHHVVCYLLALRL